MAKNSPITTGLLFAGADHTLQILVVDAAGAPQTMTGWSLMWVMRSPSADGSGAAVVTKVSPGSITLTSVGGVNNQATVSILRADTLAVAPGKYGHTLWRTDTGLYTPIAYGLCVLEHPERTNP